MYITILGRQPALSMAELEHLYGPGHVRWFSDQSALVEADTFSIDHLGGSQKAGQVVIELPRSDWRQVSTKITAHYAHTWSGFEGKLTLGISAYGFNVTAREVQQTGIILKQRLKKAGVSLRLVPNTEPVLSSATSHHNKLGLSSNKVELLVIRARDGRVSVAESIGAQNITALARRDQERPKRDAFVGMLPPKLAQIMINLAAPRTISIQLRQPVNLSSADPTQLERQRTTREAEETVDRASKHAFHLLDPFCGTGVILQEAALMGHVVYGTDINEKMIDFSRTNLEWLASSHHIDIDAKLHPGDAMDTKWQPPIDAVVAETYLGQPFSAPPSPAKLDQVRRNCDHIISTFLKNIAAQLTPGTPLCIAVPAWRHSDGSFTHLPLIGQLETFGFTWHKFTHIHRSELLYYREDQIVARELLILVKS